MRVKFKKRCGRILSICITMFMLVGMLPFSNAVFAGTELSADKVQVDSFKIIDEANANTEVDYVTDADAAKYNLYINDASNFKTRRTARLSYSSLHHIRAQRKSMKGTPFQLRLLTEALLLRALLKNSLKIRMEIFSEHTNMKTVYSSLSFPAIILKIML